MKIGMARTRIILDKEIEETLPINYDALQELVEKASDLNSCLFVPHCGWYKSGKEKYVEYLTFIEILNKFYISIKWDISFDWLIEEFIAYFLAYRSLFNLFINHEKQWHVEIFNTCKTPNKAWELFNRIEYLINNFETEILLSNTEGTEDV